MPAISSISSCVFTDAVAAGAGAVSDGDAAGSTTGAGTTGTGASSLFMASEAGVGRRAGAFLAGITLEVVSADLAEVLSADFTALVLATLGFADVETDSLSDASGMCMTGCDAVAIGAGSPLTVPALAGTADASVGVALVVGGATLRVGVETGILGALSVPGAGASGALTGAGDVAVAGGLADTSVLWASAAVEEKARTAAIAVRPGRSGVIVLSMPGQLPAEGKRSARCDELT
jgi:hypothetical protein